MLKAQLLWILLRTLIAGIYAFFTEELKKKSNMHDIRLFLINWHDRVGKKQFTTISYFLKILCLKMVLEISD